MREIERERKRGVRVCAWLRESERVFVPEGERERERVRAKGERKEGFSCRMNHPSEKLVCVFADLKCCRSFNVGHQTGMKVYRWE